jgi:hypothetical protein
MFTRFVAAIACFTVLLAASLPASARSGAAVVDLEGMPIATGSGKQPTAEQVKNAVIAGARRAKWTTSVQPNNSLQLTFTNRKHVAVVKTTYSSKTYSITYADSTNLNYEMEKGQGTIHPNYNKWVEKLRHAIDAELRRL